jgi:hypothetical protein
MDYSNKENSRNITKIAWSIEPGYSILIRLEGRE